jgi:hypothetical protein
MSNEREKQLIALAERAIRQSALIDFWPKFNPASPATWCYLVRDVVAFANSGGGIIVFGIKRGGKSSGTDCRSVLKSVPEKLSNQIFNFSGVEFSGIEMEEVRRSDGLYPALLIKSADVPMIFAKDGTYAKGDQSQETLFVRGTVYFRHSNQSVPGDSQDLRRWRDRAFAERRAIQVGTPMKQPADVALAVVMPKNTGGVGSVIVHSADELWPYRRPELLRALNARLPSGVRIGMYDIVSINRMIDVFHKHPEFATKPHAISSPQYSPAYMDWIIDQIKADPDFLRKCRAAYRQ